MFTLRHITFCQCHKEKKVKVYIMEINITLCEEPVSREIKGVKENDQKTPHN